MFYSKTIKENIQRLSKDIIFKNPKYNYRIENFKTIDF
jgi:hypothetical protein